MTRSTLSARGVLVAQLASDIEYLDQRMKIKSDELLFMMRKKDMLQATLYANLKAMKRCVGENC